MIVCFWNPLCDYLEIMTPRRAGCTSLSTFTLTYVTTCLSPPVDMFYFWVNWDQVSSPELNLLFLSAYQLNLTVKKTNCQDFKWRIVLKNAHMWDFVHLLLTALKISPFPMFSVDHSKTVQLRCLSFSFK